MKLSDQDVQELCIIISSKTKHLSIDRNNENILIFRNDILKIVDEIELPEKPETTCIQDFCNNKLNLLLITASLYEHSRYREVSPYSREILSQLRPDIADLADLYQFTSFRLLEEPYIY